MTEFTRYGAGYHVVDSDDGEIFPTAWLGVRVPGVGPPVDVWVDEEFVDRFVEWLEDK